MRRRSNCAPEPGAETEAICSDLADAADYLDRHGFPRQADSLRAARRQLARPPASAGAGEDETGYWRCVEEVVHALREPMTLADAQAVRKHLTTALVAHKKAKVRARRPAADTPTTEGREDAVDA